MDIDELCSSFVLPPELTYREEFDEILLFLINNGGSEVFIDGGDYIMLQFHSRNYRLGSRKVSIAESEAIMSFINGEESVARIKGGEPDNPSYEIEQTVEEDGIKSVRRNRFRVNAVMTLRRGRRSPCITIREIKHAPPMYSDIGLSKDDISQYTSIGTGLGLVIGPTGSGKSTLLAAIVRELMTQGDRMIVTLESPIEYAYDSIDSPSSRVRQIGVGSEVETFLEGVENCMRMKPTHIVVGESRDYPTISSAIESALTGHGVMTTVHAGRVSEAVDRMIMRYPPALQMQARLDLPSVLKFCCAQRLIKSADGKRVAVRETLFLDNDMRREIMKADHVANKVDELVNSRGRSFSQELRSVMESGVVSEQVAQEEHFDLYGAYL